MKASFLNTSSLVKSFAVSFSVVTLIATQGFAKESKAREIVLHTEVVDGSTRWLPATTSVTPGEKITLVFQHKLTTGPEFHGITIPDFKIQDKVLRNKEARFSVEIPKDAALKEILIKCQFHPAHVEAKLELSQPKK